MLRSIAESRTLRRTIPPLALVTTLAGVAACGAANTNHSNNNEMQTTAEPGHKTPTATSSAHPESPAPSSSLLESPTSADSSPKPRPTSYGVDPGFARINLCTSQFSKTDTAVISHTHAHPLTCQSSISTTIDNTYWQLGSYGVINARILLQNDFNTKTNEQSYNPNHTYLNTPLRVDGKEANYTNSQPAVLTIFVGSPDSHARIEVTNVLPNDQYSVEDASVAIGEALVEELQQNQYIS